MFLFPVGGKLLDKLRMRSHIMAVCLLAASGCLAPPSPATRVTDAARELNIASRFGRLDLAAAGTDPNARKAFIQRRSHWGSGLRVVDVELAGLRMSDSSNAVVQIDVAWVAAENTRLRVTRIAQTWSDSGGGWLLTRERRISGDRGLFGEPVPRSRSGGFPDRHFPVRRIR